MDRETSATSEGVGTVQQQALTEKKKLKVMVAVDDSDASFYALNWTLTNLIKPVAAAAPPAAGGEPVEEGCMVYVVHVQQPLHHVFPVAAGPAAFTTPSATDSVKKAQAEVSASILDRALRICEQKMVRAESLILEGDAKDMICEGAERMHVDLLVVGSRGLGHIKRALLGSVSDYCAHQAPCPVLIVKPPKSST
ncbi:hypothetical protein Ancab_032374 [Ancistrocladus abbreviatus]